MSKPDVEDGQPSHLTHPQLVGYLEQRCRLVADILTQ